MSSTELSNAWGGMNYSTDEQVVGTWIDGKPVYQRVWTGLSASIPKGEWNNDVLTVGVLGKLINIIMTRENGYILYIPSEAYITDAGKLCVLGNAHATRVISDVILQYTKTTD